MEKFEVTKEKILEAAEKCSVAKATLKILFPEAFESSLGMKRHDNGSWNNSVLAYFEDKKHWAIAFENAEEHGYRIQLSNTVNWVIEYNTSNQAFLIPKEKI